MTLTDKVSSRRSAQGIRTRIEALHAKEKSEPAGIQCPYCKRTTGHRVKNSTQNAKGMKRRRECRCGNRFTTIETLYDLGANGQGRRCRT